MPTITASSPVFDRTGKELIGVCATDFILPAEMSSFLRSLEVGRSGETFIMERSGALVAASTSEKLINDSGDTVEYLKGTESTDPLIRGTAQYLYGRFGDLNTLKHSQQLEFKLDGQRQLVQVLPFQDGRGINWLITVVVPEADFMGRIQANTRLTALLYLLSLGVAVVGGILTARWLTRPISNLNEAAKSIAQGQWQTSIDTIDRQRADELGELAQSFHQMATQLQHSFAALETQNADLQQAKDDLAHAKEQLEAVLDAMPGPISWIAANGTYLGVNSHWARSFNLSPESIVGKSIRVGGYSPDYVGFIVSFLASSEISSSQEIPMFIGGQSRHYLVAAQKYQQGTAIVVVGIDITERRLAQEALQEAQHTNQAIVSAMPRLDDAPAQ
ncbi:MAG: HAMP domain-containing protein [Leptolyngbyaceae cyanobacterium SL_7_1]|nr:HAMP domain-containing protein [Leptolyngbyaceae cyanobacterium SL_7_1]